MDARQNEEFTNFLRDAVRQAEALKYNPTRFKGMIEADGGYETVKRILASGKPSDGFMKLWELGRLDLTCEAIIVESKWRQHFDDDLIERAERLLRDSRYAFKRFQSVAMLDGSSGADSELGIVRVGVGVDEQRDGIESDDATGQGVSAFFRDVLHASLVNSRWSWGAVDERARRIYLRVWRMDIQVRGGGRLIRVLRPNASPGLGWKERQRQLELARSGYTTFAVLCDKERHDARTILGFDRDRLLRLGRVVEDRGSLWMEVVEEVAVDALGFADTSGTGLHQHLQEIEEADLAPTTKTALIEARVGQGRFRRELMRRWNYACAVTGCRVAAVLRASHCKPWHKSDHHERLDSHNGLILSANLDALFDAGMIAFDDAGKMIVAGAISLSEREALGVPADLTRQPGPRLKAYLRFHREQVFQG
jgi:hypothetical protein